TTERHSLPSTTLFRSIGKKTAQKRTLNTRPTTAMAAIATNAVTAIAARTKKMNMLSGFTRGHLLKFRRLKLVRGPARRGREQIRSEEHTSELQSRGHL